MVGPAKLLSRFQNPQSLGLLLLVVAAVLSLIATRGVRVDQLLSQFPF